MALRFGCPCGVTHTVPDELAGRTVKCTGCGRALKVGVPPSARPPGGQAPLPAPGAAPGAGMEWGSGVQKALQLLPAEDTGPLAAPPGTRPRVGASAPADDGGSLDLAPEPDAEPDARLMNSLDSNDPNAAAARRGSRRGARASGGGRAPSARSARPSGAGAVRRGARRGSAGPRRSPTPRPTPASARSATR